MIAEAAPAADRRTLVVPFEQKHFEANEEFVLEARVQCEFKPESLYIMPTAEGITIEEIVCGGGYRQRRSRQLTNLLPCPSSFFDPARRGQFPSGFDATVDQGGIITIRGRMGSEAGDIKAMMIGGAPR